ncbi:MAG: glycoside hydrolase family 16 protein [Armatimonadetes bacterium]|nr:glycoside hydrolase family 16 protein [Armatimonadota bacterium]
MLIAIAAMASSLIASDLKLVFEQDFSKLKDIDEKVWKFNDGPVYNNEKQKYTKKKAKNVWIEGGRLIIEARKEPNGTITSGRLESIGSWKYGTYEIVAKTPAGRGTWPAAWMLNDRVRSDAHGSRLGWPKCGEIDIMEYVGYDPGVYHFTLHSDKYNHTKGTQIGKQNKVAETQPGWHTYKMDWSAKAITIYMDGKQVFHRDKTETSLEAWPFDDPYFFILNLAIGGDWGGAKGIDDAIFPARFEIKSVRVWQ